MSLYAGDPNQPLPTVVQYETGSGLTLEVSSSSLSHYSVEAQTITWLEPVRTLVSVADVVNVGPTLQEFSSAPAQEISWFGSQPVISLAPSKLSAWSWQQDVVPSYDLNFLDGTEPLTVTSYWTPVTLEQIASVERCYQSTDRNIIRHRVMLAGKPYVLHYDQVLVDSLVSKHITYFEVISLAREHSCLNSGSESAVNRRRGLWPKSSFPGLLFTCSTDPRHARATHSYALGLHGLPAFHALN